MSQLFSELSFIAFAGNKDRLIIIPIVVVIGETSSIKDHVLPSLSQSQVEVENLKPVLSTPGSRVAYSFWDKRKTVDFSFIPHLVRFHSYPTTSRALTLLATLVASSIPLKVLDNLSSAFISIIDEDRSLVFLRNNRRNTIHLMVKDSIVRRQKEKRLFLFTLSDPQRFNRLLIPYSHFKQVPNRQRKAWLSLD
ncbi:hypothetical protein ACFE04_019684 [Oxalis oulophora]